MDYESQVRLVKQEYAADLKQLLSEVDSWAQKLSEEMKSHEDTLTQLSDLDAQLPQLKKTLSAEYKAKEAIIASNEALSSSLDAVLVELKPFEEDLQTHQRRHDIACSLKKRLSQKVPSTIGTKLAEAQTDKTILAEQEEINNLKQASKHLTDQASGLQSKLESGNLDFLNQLKKIRMVKDDIQLCKQKLARAKLKKQSCLSQMELVTKYLEIAKQRKEHILNELEELANYDSEKTSVKSSSQPENPLDMTPLV